MHGLSMSVGDLVAVDGCLSGEVEDRLDGEAGFGAEDAGDPGLGDRAVALESCDPGLVRVLVGDRVIVELTPRDLSRGRIVRKA